MPLEPSGEQWVSFTLTSRDLSYWSVVHHQWVLEGGLFRIAVGASSGDLRLEQTITVDAAIPTLPLTAMSTLEEWLAHPSGGPRLRQAIGVDDEGRPAGILGNDELVRVIGNFPLRTLAAFPGSGITHELVNSVATESELGRAD